MFAAHNGEKYISEQLDSILHQKNVGVHIIINVDSSCDGTFDICSYYANNYSNVDLLSYGDIFGGAGKNFYRLVRDSDISNYEYIAFSDQDDIWPENKLARSIEKLQKFDCYSANVNAFWENGRTLLIDKAQPQLKWDFLFEAAGPGCTYVLRREVFLEFKGLLLKHYEQIGRNVALHDWLIYAFARSRNYGWFIDSEPMMLYRQHENNQVGTNNSVAAAVKRFKLIKNKWYRHQVTQIAELTDLKDSDIYKYGLNNGYIGNIYLLCKVHHLRRRFRDRFALAVALLFNLF
nr:glycosyltransferase [Aeromonas veronii]